MNHSAVHPDQLPAALSDVVDTPAVNPQGRTLLISGILRPEVTARDVRQATRKLGWKVQWMVGNNPFTVSLIRRRDYLLRTILVHGGLFLATLVTSTLAGAMMEGGDPFGRWEDLALGIPFAAALLLILGCHELGHFVYARRNDVEVSLPYFIPAPTLIGTLGAFIRIRSPIPNRRALLEIGASGPIVGFLVALPVLAIGLSQSRVVVLTEMAGVPLGDSLLMKAMVALVIPGLAPQDDVLLSPLAFAGWIGLLVTMLNLLPIGQLDGGHVAYAVFGERHNRFAPWIFVAFVPLGFLSVNWLIWGALVLLLMRTAKHPPIVENSAPMTRRDKLVASACLAIFVLCFTPSPFPG